MAIVRQGTAFQEAWPRLFMVYRLTAVNTGDTLDLKDDYGKIIGSAFISMTGGQIFSAATIAGTVVTITNTNLTDASGFLIAVGAQPTPT